MRLSKMLIPVSAVGLMAGSTYVMAADPVSNLGIIVAADKYEMNSDNDDVDGRDETVGKGGIFYNYGNKMTGGPGTIYQIGIEARYGEKNDDEVKDATAEADLGLRMPLTDNSNFDMLVGVGYDWTRWETQDGNNDVETSNKSPFAKAALGWHHQGNTVTTRLEIGTRYSIEGEGKVKLVGYGSETVDLKNKFNPYAELNFLWDQGQGFPFTAGLYYTQTNYELDDDYELANNTELESNEFGVKLGVLF